MHLRCTFWRCLFTVQPVEAGWVLCYHEATGASGIVPGTSSGVVRQS